MRGLARNGDRRPRPARGGVGVLLLVVGLGLAPPAPGRAEEAPRDAAAYDALLPFGVRGLGGEDPPERREAVRAGLAWLAAHQSPSGAWEASGYGRWCNGKEQGDTADGVGDPLYDVGVSGLALLAFLAAGHAGEPHTAHADVVERGLSWLRSQQDAEGCVGKRHAMHYIYNHAYGAAALTEAFGMTGDPRWHEAAQRALRFTASARNPAMAWRYGVRPGDNDTSATAAVMNAVRAARIINDTAVAAGLPAPLELDPDLPKGVLEWVDRMTDPEYGRTGYISRGGQAARPQEMVNRFPGENSEATTAMALLIRMTLGQDPRTTPIMQKGIRLLGALAPRWAPEAGHMDLYYWQYGSEVMRQVGGPAWDAWREALDQALIPHQRTDTTPCQARGSWDPIGPWGGKDGGRVFSTAVAVQSLSAARAHEPRFTPPAGSSGTFRERSLADALRDKELDVHTRGRAMRAVALRGRGEALPALRDALHADEPELRAHAARAIGELRGEATLALPSLVAVLGDPYEIVRIAALRALATLGPAAASASPHLSGLLADPQPAVRRDAARAALALGATEAVGPLVTLLADTDAGVRVAAAHALAALQGRTDAGTRVLVDALGTGHEEAGLEAVEGLEVLGADLPAEGKAKLLAALEVGTPALRLRAAEALLAVSGPDALRTPAGRPSPGARATLDRALAEGDGPTTRRALALLGAMGPAAQPWLSRLADLATMDPSAALRTRAVTTLGELGETARGAAAALKLAAQDASPSVREAAVQAIARVRPGPGSEIDGLVGALAKTPVATRAARALLALGGDAVPALVKAMEQEDEPLADAAMWVLVRIGDAAVSPLVRALESPSPPLRSRAATILGRVDVPAHRLSEAGEGLTRLLVQAPARGVADVRGTLLRIGRPAVPSLVAAFAAGDASARTRVLDALARILPPAPDVLPVFLVGLGHADQDVRRSAAQGLARYGPQARGAVAALGVAARDSDASVRRAAIEALGNVGRAADTTLPVVVAALRDGDEAVAAAARAALTCLDRVTLPMEALGSLDGILADLGSADVGARRAASASLVLIGPEAAPAVDRLAAAMADIDPAVRSWAAQALARQGESGAAQLAQVLQQGSSVAREAAVEALGRMGEEAASEAPPVLDALALSRLRPAAVRTLGRMGKPAVAKLGRALQDERAAVREGAALALARIGPDASAARSALIKLAKEEREKSVRQAALDALAAQGRNGISALKSLLKPPAAVGVRRAAAETLGALGVEAESALSTLKSAERREKDARVKEALGAAIVRIQNGEGSTYAAPANTLACDRGWHYLDESLPAGVEARVDALLRFDASGASLEDRAQRAFDLVPAQGNVQYVVEPSSGLIGLDLEDDAMLVTGEVVRNLISRGAITVEILLRSSDPDATLAVVGARGESAATNVPWSLRVVRGKLEALHEVGEGRDIVAALDVPLVDELRLLTLTRDGLGLLYRLYVNGQPASMARVEEGPAFAEGEKYFYLGPLKGVVLGVRVTGATFTPSQVRDAYDRLRRE